MAWISMMVARSLRHLARLDVALDAGAGSPRHLVVHGPSGSGKTTLLAAVADEIRAELVEGKRHPAAKLDRAAHLELRMAYLGRPVRLEWACPTADAERALKSGTVIAAYLPVRRTLAAPKTPPALGTAPAPPHVSIAHRFGGLLMGRSQAAAVARRIEDNRLAQRHEAWLSDARGALRRLLGQPSLKLVLDGAELQLDLADGRRMRIADLSSGHASILAIYAEVLLRVEAARQLANDPSFQPEGTVLIDAPERDLDVRLQRELLPTLSSLFPGLQWIVATHSPFVAPSLDGALVYDLDRHSGRSSEDLRRDGDEAMVQRMAGQPPGALPSRPPPASLPPVRPPSERPPRRAPLSADKTDPAAPFTAHEGSTILGTGPSSFGSSRPPSFRPPSSRPPSRPPSFSRPSTSPLAPPRVPRETLPSGGDAQAPEPAFNKKDTILTTPFAAPPPPDPDDRDH